MTYAARCTMLIDMREAMANRACAAIDNIRALEIQHALQLSPAAAWVLAKMETDRAGVPADEIHYESQTEQHPFFRKGDLINRLVSQIHDRIGGDSTLTEDGIVRLTPLGRLRVRRAIGEIF